MAGNEPQPRLRDSRDTLIANRSVRFHKTSTGSFGSTAPDESEEKFNNDRSPQATDSASAPSSIDDADRDIEKEADTPKPKSRNDSQPSDPNLVIFDGPDDPANPQNFSKGKKWMITILLSLMTLTIAFSSSVFSTAILVVSKKYHVGTEVGTLGVS
jgi:DHA1 family multidrug resistance protein-like MFS transporter